MIDTKKIEGLIREILVCLGENPDREGLIDTPKRVAGMYEEIFKGINYTNDQITVFDKGIIINHNKNRANLH